MRIAHITDLHYSRPVGATELLNKRLLGVANLHLGGRAREFGGPGRRQLIRDVLELAPDLVVITGDLTTLATAAEFQAARDALQPILDSLPVMILAGNHDRYTSGSLRARRMEKHFGAWMDGGTWEPAARTWSGWDTAIPPARFDIDDVTVLALDTARPDLLSRGRMDPDHLDRLGGLLAGDALEGRCVLLAMHYPPVAPNGTPYTHPTHGLTGRPGAAELVDLLRRHPVEAVLHGHSHAWFVAKIDSNDGDRIPVLNCGSSGLAADGAKEAGYFLLETEGAALKDVRRRTYRNGSIVEEPTQLLSGTSTGKCTNTGSPS